MGERAQELFDDARKLLDEIVEQKLLVARGVAGFFPANSVGDDIELYSDETRTRPLATFFTLRQQMQKPEGEPEYALADFVAPKESGLADYLGAFAVTTGIGAAEAAARFEKAHDDYNAIMVKALADRLAEAFAEWMHKQARDAWGFGREENLTPEDLLHERYRGIRPAPGYPASPDHTEKATLFAFAGCGTRDGHHANGEFRHAARGFGLRHLFFASAVALLCGGKDRARSSARLPAPQGPGVARHRALAGPAPELRTRGGLAELELAPGLTLPGVSLRVTDSRARRFSKRLGAGEATRIGAGRPERCHRKTETRPWCGRYPPTFSSSAN